MQPSLRRWSARTGTSHGSGTPFGSPRIENPRDGHTSARVVAVDLPAEIGALGGEAPVEAAADPRVFRSDDRLADHPSESQAEPRRMADDQLDERADRRVGVTGRGDERRPRHASEPDREHRWRALPSREPDDRLARERPRSEGRESARSRSLCRLHWAPLSRSRARPKRNGTDERDALPLRVVPLAGAVEHHVQATDHSEPIPRERPIPPNVADCRAHALLVARPRARRGRGRPRSCRRRTSSAGRSS